jgi:hypothetical protein
MIIGRIITGMHWSAGIEWDMILFNPGVVKYSYQEVKVKCKRI